MVKAFRMVVLAALVMVSGWTRGEEEPDFMENRFVVILSAYPSFAEAKKDAEKIAKESKTAFSMEGRVFDARRGLIYPDNFEDEVFRGQYVARRSHDTVLKDGGDAVEYLSIERSDGYEGFRKGFYIVVAGIRDNAKDAEKDVARYKKWAPTGYYKKTRIYMGCMH